MVLLGVTSHDHARSRVYRWEDGIANISDKYPNLCFCLGLWNGDDAILKSIITGEDGNHGEDVKELYYYLITRLLISYEILVYCHHEKFPYGRVRESQGVQRMIESMILDTGIFGNKYFDVYVKYKGRSGGYLHQNYS